LLLAARVLYGLGIGFAMHAGVFQAEVSWVYFWGLWCFGLQGGMDALLLLTAW
jgi:hypothetical protein